MSTIPTITLKNGTSGEPVTIPQLGFGTYQIDPADCVEAVTTALDLGYRHLDTAQMYGNEAEVGEAVRTSSVPREEIFITSKLNNNNHERDDALRSFDTTLTDLGVDTLDLFLIHWPLPGIDVDYVETWKAMEEMLASGRVRAIGVSNFQPDHLDRLREECDVLPALNQVETHPYFQQRDLFDHGRRHGIEFEAWSPIAQGDVVDDEVLGRIGEAHGKSAAQVALRWHLQSDHIIFPKSTTPERIAENIDLFDFALSDEEMAEIVGLDRGDRKGPNPDEFNMVP